MGSGGSRGLQSRCKARRMSWVCSIRTRLRQETHGAHRMDAPHFCKVNAVSLKLRCKRDAHSARPNHSYYGKRYLLAAKQHAGNADKVVQTKPIGEVDGLLI